MERSDELIEALRPLASTERTSPIYWIDGLDDNADFCGDCVEPKVDELEKAEPDKQFSVDGGWTDYEADGSRICRSCGLQLDHCLTKAGVESELEHFEQSDTMQAPLASKDAFSVMQLLHVVGGHLDEELERRVVAVGERAVGLLAPSPTPTA